jgi:hypothetical protein
MTLFHSPSTDFRLSGAERGVPLAIIVVLKGDVFENRFANQSVGVLDVSKEWSAPHDYYDSSVCG